MDLNIVLTVCIFFCVAYIIGATCYRIGLAVGFGRGKEYITFKPEDWNRAVSHTHREPSQN